MKITFLGTGTSQGVPVIACGCDVCRSEDEKDKRLRCSVLIETAENKMVIDTGPDFRQQMLRAGVERLDAVLFTHSHKDHIAGMDDIRAFNFKQQKAMRIYAAEEVQAALRKEFHYVFAKDPYPGIPRVQPMLIDRTPFEVDGITVTPVEVMHYKMPVLGFRIADLAYVTDAKTISETEKEKLKGLDVLVLNALRKEEHISHLNLDEALGWVEELKPKKAYFTHISHLMGKHEEVGRHLPLNVALAYDGLVIEV